MNPKRKLGARAPDEGTTSCVKFLPEHTALIKAVDPSTITIIRLQRVLPLCRLDTKKTVEDSYLRKGIAVDSCEDIHTRSVIFVFWIR